MKDYLRCHKSFLEDYLLQEIPVAVLQNILKRKTSSRESGQKRLAASFLTELSIHFV